VYHCRISIKDICIITFKYKVSLKFNSRKILYLIQKLLISQFLLKSVQHDMTQFAIFIKILVE